MGKSLLAGSFAAFRKGLAHTRRLRRSLSRADHGRGGSVRIDLLESPNSHWEESERGQRLTVRVEPLISRQTRVLTIGSCFAVELRKALRASGVDVYPRYFDIELEQGRETIGLLPRRDNVNHYDTFAIRQEFERALSLDDAARARFRPLRVREGAATTSSGAPLRYQDPYRKNVLAVDHDAIARASQKIDDCFRLAVERADVYVITLGLVEIWQDLESGLAVWSEKVRRLAPDPDRIRFRRSGFRENYENVRWICSSLRDRFPGKKVVLTVSPVGLKRTFTADDIVVANNYSKSVLRAVAGQVADEFDNVLYWPSYEIASKMDLFTGDGRHVSAEGVEFIVASFLRAYARA